MPCPRCDHTLQNIGAKDQRIFWCPRCGTLVTETEDSRTESLPTLANVVKKWWSGNGPTFDPSRPTNEIGTPWLKRMLECVGIKSDRGPQEK